jgi:hypothetical protein
MGYSAACLAWSACFIASRTASNAAVARSKKPGMVGAKGRNDSRVIPAASADRKNASRLTRKACDAIWSPPKSCARTAHRKKSSVSSGLSSSGTPYSSSGVVAFILPHLSGVCLAQGFNPAERISQSVDADMDAPVQRNKGNDTPLSIVMACIRAVVSLVPIQPHSLAQPNAMLGTVLRVLLLIPFEFHSHQLQPVAVNARLSLTATRGRK